jgi:DNA-binding SARP family transcriptional activator
MGGSYIEWRTLESKSISWDIAHHLYVRQFQGPAIIITERPTVMLPAVRKQWQKIARQAQKERSSTIKTERVAELKNGMEHMEHLQFSAKLAKSSRTTDVLFVTPERLEEVFYSCHTLYVTTTLSDEQMRILERILETHGLLVIYHPGR